MRWILADFFRNILKIKIYCISLAMLSVVSALHITSRTGHERREVQVTPGITAQPVSQWVPLPCQEMELSPNSGKRWMTCQTSLKVQEKEVQKYLEVHVFALDQPSETSFPRHRKLAQGLFALFQARSPWLNNLFSGPTIKCSQEQAHSLQLLGDHARNEERTVKK